MDCLTLARQRMTRMLSCCTAKCGVQPLDVRGSDVAPRVGRFQHRSYRRARALHNPPRDAAHVSLGVLLDHLIDQQALLLLQARPTRLTSQHTMAKALPE